MRILMLSQFFPPTIGGEERHVKVLSEALVQRGHDVSVATLRQHDENPFEVVNGVKLHRLQGTLQRNSALFAEAHRRHAPPFPDPELTYGLNRVVRSEQASIVHAHNWLLHSYLPLQAMYSTKLVVTLHDYGTVCAKKNMIHQGNPCSGPAPAKCLSCAVQHYGNLKGAVTWLTNSVSSRVGSRLVDTFIPVSRAVADRCKLDQAQVPYEIIPTFIADDVRTLSEELDDCIAQLPEEGFLLFVGDLTRLKGLHDLLEAYGTFVDAPPLVLIGRRCRDTPTTLPKNVTLFESWPHRAVLHAWSRCLFGLAPSIGLETCGTVVMEANAFGKPVIACNIGGLSETVLDGKTGILVAPGDAPALRGALEALITNRELRERLAVGSFRHADSFMTKSVVPRIENIYARAGNSRGNASGLVP